MFRHASESYIGRQWVFPYCEPEAMAMLSLFYNPERMYRLSGISFSGGREALTALQKMGPLCSVDIAKKLEEQFQGDDPLLYKLYADECMKVSATLAEPELLYNAGMTEGGLYHAVTVAVTAVHNALHLATWGRSKDKVMSFTPLVWLNDKKAAQVHLTWEACRWIQNIMTTGGYRPQRLRKVEINKGDGGKRPLNIPTVVDRTVERAAFMTLEPMFEQRFRPNSVGCRYDLDRFDALAALYHHFPKARGKYILCADIRKAFDNVRHEDLLACLKKHIPDSRMLSYLEMTITRPGTNRGEVGIHQGGPLSPMFLNVLLHERLDQPFLKCLREDLVYIRYVDDLAVFGFESEAEGKALLARLQGILKPIGLALHTDPPKTQIVNLARARIEVGWDTHPTATLDEDDGVDRYLGLGLYGNAEGQLDFFLPRSWPERLADMYRRADEKIAKGGYTGTMGAKNHILRATWSWMRAFSPAFHPELEESVLASIIDTCTHTTQHYSAVMTNGLHDEYRDSMDWWQERKGETSEKAMLGWVAVKERGTA